MAFPISKQVLLASPVPLSSGNLSKYLCANTTCQWAYFPCIRERLYFHGVCRTVEHTRVTMSICGSFLPPYFSLTSSCPSAGLIQYPEGPPVWMLCCGLAVLSSMGPPWQDWVGALLPFSVGLRKREQPMDPHKGRVFPWEEAEKSIKKPECHLENLERCCKGLA